MTPENSFVFFHNVRVQWEDSHISRKQTLHDVESVSFLAMPFSDLETGK